MGDDVSNSRETESIRQMEKEYLGPEEDSYEFRMEEYAETGDPSVLKIEDVRRTPDVFGYDVVSNVPGATESDLAEAREVDEKFRKEMERQELDDYAVSGTEALFANPDNFEENLFS